MQRKFRHAGLRVKDDFAIVSSGNLTESEEPGNRITIVSTNLDEIYGHAFEMLLAEMKGTSRQTRRHVATTKLFIRGSCGEANI